MSAKFVVRKFYKNGNSEYFQAEGDGEYYFSQNIFLSWCFDTYEEAENKINSLKGLFQIEKVFFKD